MEQILFEDHNHLRLRPLSAGLPSWEVRCGIFCTRERVERVSGGTGGLLGRRILLPLNRAPGWLAQDAPPSGRSFWWHGRLAPRGGLLAGLWAQRDGDWVLRDEHGLLAAALPAAAAHDLHAAWQRWEKGLTDELVLPPTVLDLPAPRRDDPAGPAELGWIWDLVPATAAAIAADLDLVGSGEFARHPFGIAATGHGDWTVPGGLAPADPDGVHRVGDHPVYLGTAGVRLAPGTHLDTTAGPIVLDAGVQVQPHVYLAGPLHIGRGSQVKAGARIYGESSFGLGNRLAGEIGESTFGEFANKQHDGFIGHAVLGSWVNLGALTTCSDLKNNYGNVRVDLGGGEVDTGLRFVGLMMGDHAKTAIGTLFNTGTVVGFASNVFGGGMPPKSIPAFSWGGAAGAPRYEAARARATAEIVLGRRDCVWTADHARLFDFVAARSGG